MAKRQKSGRSKPGEYIHYGKPTTVPIVRREFEYEDGHREVKYVEEFGGESYTTDSRTAHDGGGVSNYEAKTSGLLHPKGCALAKDCHEFYWRGGKPWCSHDYELRWGVTPVTDPHLEAAPIYVRARQRRRVAAPRTRDTFDLLNDFF